MKIPRVKAYRYKINPETNTVSYIPEEITKNIDITQKGGIENTKDTFQLKLKPSRDVSTDKWDSPIVRNSPSENILTKGDFVSVFAWYGTHTPSDDELKTDHTLIYGVIDTFDSEASSDEFTITAKGANATEDLLNTMSPYSTKSYTGSFNTAPTAIKFLINKRIRKFNPNRRVYAYLDNEINEYTGSYGRIASKKSDGTDFPKIDYAKSWRSIYRQIEELSTTEYTNDKSAGTYMFSVRPVNVLPDKRSEVGDVINEVVWQPKTEKTSHTLVEGKDFSDFDLSWDVRNVYNAFIVNAGTDLNGVGIIGVVYNADSMSQHGAKWKYYTKDRQMFSDLLTEEKKAGRAAGSTFEDPTGYPDSLVAGSTWYFEFNKRDELGSVTDTRALGSTEKHFNTVLSNEALWKSKNRAQEVVDNLGEPRFKLDAVLTTGSNKYINGDLIDVTLPSLGWMGTDENPPYKLRLMDTNHRISKKGWTTKLTLEEDEEVLSKKIN